MRALIVEDGVQRGALAAARALARAGWTVGIASPRPGFASASRATARRHEAPPPEAGEEDFLKAVRAAIDAGGYELVFGAGDGEVVALSGGRDSLPAVVPYPEHESVLRAVDKVRLAEAAAEVGLGVPETRAADEAALRSVDGPVIVKPRLTTAGGAHGEALRLRAILAADADEAERQAAFLSSLGAEPLLQRYVPGPLTALIVLADRAARSVVTVQQRAEAIWPSEVGGSVRAQTVAVDPRLEELVGKLLMELGWFGLAQVQFQSGGSGESMLIDLNARFYGSMALALAAGPNLPAIWAALATGRRSPVVVLPQAGVRYQWLEADLRRALRERRGGLARDVRGTLGYAQGAVHGLWDVRDPWPALRHAAVLGFRAVRKLARRRAPEPA